jgi:hypothetical protein
MANYDLNMNGQFINNCLDPALAQDVATKNYIDKRAVEYTAEGQIQYAGSSPFLPTTLSVGASGDVLTLAGSPALPTWAPPSTGGVSIPIGGIIMWFNAVPPDTNHWGLCDGTTYGSVLSPNLVDKFILGGVTGGATGGYHDITLPNHYHTHTLTPHTHAAAPHNHGYNIPVGDHAALTPGVDAYRKESVADPQTTANGDVTIAPNADDFLTIHYAGVSGTNNYNYPPYYTLAFYMRYA